MCLVWGSLSSLSGQKTQEEEATKDVDTNASSDLPPTRLHLRRRECQYEDANNGNQHADDVEIDINDNNNGEHRPTIDSFQLN